MLAMWTTKSEPKSFTYRNGNTFEQNVEKNHFSCQSKSTIMDAANLQQKNSYSNFQRQKISYRPETDNQIKANSKTVGIKV